MTRLVDFTATNAIVWRPGEDPVESWRRGHRARKALEDFGVVTITASPAAACCALGAGTIVAVPDGWGSGVSWAAAAVVTGGAWAVSSWRRFPGRLRHWWTERCHRMALLRLARWTTQEQGRQQRDGAASGWAWIGSDDVPVPYQSTMRRGCMALERLRQQVHDGFLPARTVTDAHRVVWAACARLHSAQALRENVAAQQRIARNAGDRSITAALTRAEAAEADALEWLECVLRAAREITTSRGDRSTRAGVDPEALRMELDTLLSYDQRMCMEFDTESTRSAADGVCLGVDAALELADSSRPTTRHHGQWRPGGSPGATAP